MRKFLTILFMTLLAYAAGYDVGWAEEKTEIDLTGLTSLSFSDFSNVGSSYTTPIQGAFPASDNNSYNGWIKVDCSYNSTVHTLLQMKKNSGVITTPTIKSPAGFSVTVIYGASNITISTGNGESETGSKVGSSTSLTGSVTLETNSTNTTFTIAAGLNATYIKSITFTPKASTSSSHTLTNGSSNGSVMFTVDDSPVTEAAAGATVTATATADPGYEFDSWNEPSDVSGWNESGNTATFIMPAAAVSVSANFTAATPSTAGVMTYTPTSNSAGVLENAPNSSVTASISGFYSFTEGQGAQRTSSNTAGTITFSNLPSNYKVTKIEVQYCTNKSSGNGTISATLNGSSIGSSFSVNAPSSGGTTVKSTTLYENSTGTVFDGDLVISTAVTTNSVYIYKVLVTYEQIPQKAYSITVDSGITHGSVAVSPTSSDGNENITVTATPDTGYKLASLTFNNGTPVTVNSGWSVSNGVYTYTYPFDTGDLVVSATFTPIPTYAITIDSDITGGSVSVNPSGNQKEGEIITLTATPAVGYQFSEWNVYKTDETSTIVPVDANKFTMPAYPVTVSATFNVKKENNSNQYQLVTSAGQIEAGKKYLIASNGATALLGEVENNIGTPVYEGFTVDNDIITLESTCTATPLTLGGDATNGWTFNNGSGFLAYTKGIGTTKNNNLFIVENATDNGALWTINTANLSASNKLITNIYNTERNLQFNSDRFCAYTSNQSAIALYKLVEALPLAELLTNGQTGETYTVTDRLIGVYAKDNTLWAKDEATSIDANAKPNKDYKDFLLDVAFTPKALEDLGVAHISVPDIYSQNNWIALVMPEGTTASNYVGKYLLASTVTGVLTNDENYELTLTKAPGEPVNTKAYTKNVYTPANFVSTFWGVNDDRIYFVKPKVQEVANIVWAVWDGSKFVMPNKIPDEYAAVKEASFTPDFSMNSESNPTLTSGYAYAFEAVIENAGTTLSGARRLKNAVSPTAFTVKPLNLTSSDPVITGISNVGGSVKEVKSVRVYNVAGVEQRELQPGVNIVVTTYTDGTRSTAKVLR